MKALTLDAEHRAAVVEEVAYPECALHEVIVQVKAVALNPIDALYTEHPLGSTGRIMGSDFSGVIVTIGSAVPDSSHLRVGTGVAGFLQGHCSVNARSGAFAEYLAAPWDLVWQIKDLTFEQAATVSLCALTAAQALFYRLDLAAPFPWTAREPKVPSMGPRSVFINGSTTSVGLYAAQLARRASEPVVMFGSASPKNFAWLGKEPYRYDELVDYRSENSPLGITALREGAGVDMGFDCISEGLTVLRTAQTLKPASQLAVVRSRAGKAWDTPVDALGVEPVYGAVWEGLGERVEYAGMTLPPNLTARAFTVAFYSWLSEGGHIAPNPVRSMPGGLERIAADGFLLLGSGSMTERKLPTDDAPWMKPISAEKLVYLIG